MVGITAMKALTSEINDIKNNPSRIGGFSHSQWVLGRSVRSPGDQCDEDEYVDVGVLSAKLDSTTAFGQRHSIREAARTSLVEVDCSKRVARALLRKAAPTVAQCPVGDLICVLREQGAQNAEDRWSTASRIIGFEGDKSIWVLCERLPV